ncbi:MAG: chromosome segregation protein SMC, partial [Leptospiraceae bacterium]|nr:chromosome segregation protein SMC [Leptospiraceae bacterium]
LMMDLSARHKQISTLQNRIENLKEETEEMKRNFEKLLEQADEKFEKLSDFLSVLDSIYISNGKKGSSKDSELMKKKKATVLQLYENFDWSIETIAEKLNLEKSLVEAIINSRNTGKDRE